MKYLLLLLVLLLAGCDSGEYIITDDPAMMREFQRTCLARSNHSIEIARLGEPWYKFTCKELPKTPISEEDQ